MKNWEGPRMRKYLLILFLFCVQHNCLKAHQDTLSEMTDSASIPEEVVHPKYEYWKKDYYKDIRSIDTLDQPKNQEYHEMIGKYQTKEFEYVESISDKISVWGSIYDWINKFFKDLFPDIDANPGDWFYNLLGIGGAVFVVFLLYKFFFSGRQFLINPKEESVDEESTLAFVEKNLLDIDIHEYIKSAIDSTNYSLAIRYQQLLNIQLLAKKNIIAWDQTKTNMELMDQIKQEGVRQDFKRCSSLFDYVWFGDFEIDATKFEEITKEFNEFQRRWS
ncbi:hypothetical protein [Sphingobacterium bovistauri]|uniref:DUF4129 domain-containing protein n=1 Tax=Sphingobacterium bovistauri TaxID=2781959 RepID=A0ABS7Z8J1_9SPHI|nr:hypothetical protein [Sphingobacterium bovistauri]MCA5005867.1 hypothetical protein [Sphingobacterium bovistauri]